MSLNGRVTNEVPHYVVTAFDPDGNPVTLTVDADGKLLVDATVSVTASGSAIQDGADAGIEATVKDYANSNPLCVINVDTDGNPTGGAAVSIADGADVALGAVADAAVVGDNTGTVSAKLRGLNKILADVWDSVDGTLAVEGPLTDTELRASVVPVRTDPTSVTTLYHGGNQATVSAGGALKVDGSAATQPVSAASLPLPTGAATAAKQPALGTAGTAASDVISVQGIASMTPLDVAIVSGAGSGGTASNFGDAIPAAGTAAGFQDASGNMAPGLLDASGFLKVNVAAGGAGGGTVDQGTAGVDPWLVEIDNATLAVTGPLTDTELRATPVPVSGTVTAAQATAGNLNATVVGTGTFATQAAQSGTWNITNISGTVSLPTGAATAALQTQPGVDIGDVTINNAAGASAVNIQDGGNAITVDGTVAATQSGTWTEANSAAIKTAVETLDNAISGSEMQVDVVAALPAGTNLLGKVSAGLDTASIYDGATALTPKFAVIDAATSGDNTIVAAVTSKKVRVVAAFLVSSGTVNVRFESGASGTALTGQMNLVANTGFVLPFNPAGWFETGSNTLLNLELSGAVSVDGSITYIEV